MGSSRLPGKSLRPLAGLPMVLHVLYRALAIPGVSSVWLATSDEEPDRALALAASGIVSVYCGSSWDVLSRYVTIARVTRAQTIVRVTGDCPCLAPDVAAQVLEAHDGVGYTWNDTAHSGYADGFDVEVFSADVLYAADIDATERQDREHVTPIMRELVEPRVVRCEEDWTRLKLSVDTEDDFERVRALYGYLPAKDYRMATTLDAARKAGLV